MTEIPRRAALALCLAAPAAAVLSRELSARAVDPLRVTYVAAPFNVPLIVMRRRNLLEAALAPHGIAVEWPEITSGAKQVQAMAAGSVDVASVLGGASAILGRANGAPVRVVGAFHRAPRAYQILAMPRGPQRIEDLRGKRIAGPMGTILHQLLAAALAKHGMRLTDVNHVNMDIPAARAALIAGSIDAATLAGNNALVVEQAGGRIIADGEGLIAPTVVIGAADRFIEGRRPVLDTYLTAHRQALEFLRTQPDEALALAAAEQRLSLDDARRMLAWYDFSPTITDADIANLEADQRFMREAGMLTRSIDIARDLIHPMALG
jgi:sulfonate transport system substrate-binding protein